MKRVDVQEFQFHSSGGATETINDLINFIPKPLLLLDESSKVVEASQSFCNFFKMDAEDVFGKLVYELDSGRWNMPKLKKLLEEILPKKKAVQNVEIEFNSINIGRRIMRLDVRLVNDFNGAGNIVLLTFEDISRFKQIEEDLIDSELTYQTLLNQSTDGIFSVDLSGAFLAVNQAICDLLHYTEEELLSMKIWDVLLHPQIADLKNRFSNILKGKFNNEAAIYEVKGRDGSLFQIEVVSAPLHKANKVVGFQATARHIVRSKEDDHVLRKEESMLYQSQRLAHIGSWSWDLTGPFRWTTETYHIFDVSPEFFIPTLESTLQLVYPEDRPALEQWLLGEGISDLQRTIDFRIPLSDNSVRFISISGDRVCDNRDRFVYMAGTVQDITERKRGHEALKRNEQKFVALAEQSPNLIFIYYDKRIVYVNQRCVDVMGYSREEYYAEDFDFRLLIDEQYQDIITKNLQNRNPGEPARPLDYRIITRDNTPIDALITTELIDYDDGKAIMGTITDITERKKAEEILRESENRTRKVLEAISTGIMLVDPETFTIVDVNAEAVRLIGEKKNKIIGRHCSQFLYVEENKDCVNAGMGKMLDHTERLLIDKDGNHIPILITVRQIKLAGRKLYLQNFIDISERKLATERVNQSESRYRNLFENSGAAIWDADISEVQRYLTGVAGRGIVDFRKYFEDNPDEVRKCASMVRLHDANKELQKLLKATSKEQVLTSLTDFYIDESYVTIQDVLVELAEGKLRTDGEIPLKILSGEIIQVLFQLSVVSEEEGIWTKGLISFSDITDKKNTEQALRESEKHLREILENVDAVFYMMSGKTGEMAYINTAYERIWKRPVAEIMESPEAWLEAVHPDDVKAAINLFEKGSGELQYRIVLPGGEVRWIWDRMFPILDENGEQVFLCGMAADITDRKLHESEILRSERNYRNLFENAGVAIWEEDLSDVKKYIDQLKDRGVQDFRKYFDEHPEEVIKCSSKARLLDANKEVLNVLKAKNKDEVFKSLPEYFVEESLNETKEELIALSEGKFQIEGELPIKILTGELRELYFKLTVISGYEDTWSKALFSFIDITERKKIEESLRLFQTLINKSNDAIEVIDVETGQFIDVNERACTDLGYSRSELLDMKVFDIDPLQTTENFEALMEGFQLSNSTIIETMHQRKDGSLFPVEVNVTVVELERIYTIAVVRDITERKRAEKELAASKERYKVLFESAAEGILVVDVEMEALKLVNKAACRMFGYTQKEMLKLNVVDLHPAESLPEVVAAFKNHARLDNPASAEMPCKRKDGSLFYASVYSVTVMIDDRKHSIGFFTDITRQKEAGEKVKLFRTLIDHSNDPIELIDMETGRVLDCNEKAYLELGYTRKEFLSLHLSDIDPTLAEDSYAERIKLVRNSDGVMIESVHRRKDGSEFPVEQNLRYVRLDREYIVAVVRDITERKREEVELISAKNKAEESDRLKSSFLANMSHEIRTPMNGILGFTELLKEDMLSGEERQQYIEIIEQSGHRMLSIINDIINISKIESGQVDIVLSDTNINEQLEYIYRFFKPEAEQKNLKLSYKSSLRGKTAVIRTDREKLLAVLMNLVKNSLKFTQSGSIEFSCEQKGDCLWFVVKDTGIGIKPEQKEIIFERFRQGSESLTRDYEGAGLGLSISRAYIELLGGEIGVENNADLPKAIGNGTMQLSADNDRGATFYFNIPADWPENEEKDVEVLLPGNANGNHLRKLKILLAEDDAASEMLASILVRNYAKEIMKVRMGSHAVEACRNNPDIDLILMDVKMPEMDGYEATRQIRKFNKDVVIIAQTAYGFENDREKALEVGCNNYISKPIDREELGGMINRYFFE